MLTACSPATSSGLAFTPATRFAATRSGRLRAREARPSCSAASTPRCIQTRPVNSGRGRRRSRRRRHHLAARARSRGARRAATDLRGRTGRCRALRAGALGVAAGRPLHVGIGADGPRVPQALFVLLGVAHRRPETAAAPDRQCGGGDRRAPASGAPVRRACRRQLLSRHARGPGHGGASAQHRQGSNSCGRCGPSDSS